MTRRIVLVLAIAAASATLGGLLGPVPGSAQETSGPPDTVTVEARRKVDIEPDLGIVSLGVRVSGATAREATDELTHKTRAVIQALKGIGFTDEEISTVNVELDRKCLQFCRSETREPVVGFVGTAGVQVETSQIDRLGEIIDVGIDAGANRIRKVAFDVADKAEAEKEALRQAMRLAIEKAQVLAETGDRTRGRALVIEEGNTRAPERFVVADAFAAAAGRAAGSADNPFPIEPPTLQASARVVVTFELI